MTNKEQKLNEIHKIIKELYGDCVRVDIGITYEDMQIEAKERSNIRGYSMRKINGEPVSKTDL